MSPAIENGLQSLLLCSDDKVVRVLRRVLGEMEIAMEHCTDLDAGIQRLTRQRFEAVIVDCTSHEVASKILRGARSAPANKRAITVAIIDGQSALKGAFELGAHFVLFKPISLERTKASFRSVRALMKRERRRHARVPVEIPVEILLSLGSRTMQTVTMDMSENGMAIRSKAQLPPSFRVRFVLPGTSAPIECRGEVAWGGEQLKGIRFPELDPAAKEQLTAWIARQLQESDADDPPVNCKLTDLSLSACYLQTESPFPVRTRLRMTMKVKVKELELQIEGIVRVMHPGAGMGVEFTQNTSEGKARVEEFIHTLVNTQGAVPDLQVRPDTIDNSPGAFSEERIGSDHGDPLLSLFRNGAELAMDRFQSELRKQRGAPQEVGV